MAANAVVRWKDRTKAHRQQVGLLSVCRYKHLHGKFVIHPVDGRRLPIVCDAESVDMALGTGAVKVLLNMLCMDHATLCCCAEVLDWCC